MIGTLSGNISEMSLSEILKLINAGKMNGRLAVTNGVEHGEAYINSGQIVHCSVGAIIGEEAFLSMLNWVEGHFNFESDIDAPEMTISKPIEQTSIEIARTNDEREIPDETVPMSETVYTPSSKENVNKPPKSFPITRTESFIKQIEEELTIAIGPLAGIIIDDSIEDLHEERLTFPDNKIPVLVEKVSNEITDEAKKLKFSQTMIESLQNFLS